MRRVVLLREDFAMFHQDITPHDYEFFRTHSGAFKRMWQEQVMIFLIHLLFSLFLIFSLPPSLPPSSAPFPSSLPSLSFLPPLPFFSLSSPPILFSLSLSLSFRFFYRQGGFGQYFSVHSIISFGIMVP